MNVMIECRLDGKTQDEILQLLINRGAKPLPGMTPVPMDGGTVVFSVEVADDSISNGLKSLPEVVEIFGDSKLDHFGGSL